MGHATSRLEHDYKTPAQTTLFRFREPTVTELALVRHPNPAETGTFINEVREVRLQSIHSKQPTNIVFSNFSDASACVLWIDYLGHEVLYGVVAPGKAFEVRTFVTHPWIFRNAETHRRLIINDSEVFIGRPEPTEAIIRDPPILEWNESRHTFYPSWFKERVRVFLLCHNHLRRWMDHPLDGTCLLPPMVGLPIEIVKMIVGKMAKECQLEQTLIRGLQAAPDLKPVTIL